MKYVLMIEWWNIIWFRCPTGKNSVKEPCNVKTVIWFFSLHLLVGYISLWWVIAFPTPNPSLLPWLFFSLASPNCLMKEVVICWVTRAPFPLPAVNWLSLLVRWDQSSSQFANVLGEAQQLLGHRLALPRRALAARMEQFPEFSSGVYRHGLNEYSVG